MFTNRGHAVWYVDIRQAVALGEGGRAYGLDTIWNLNHLKPAATEQGKGNNVSMFPLVSLIGNDKDKLKIGERNCGKNADLAFSIRINVQI
jgi:hypothetical protein